jgi:poly(3-hydroxybutyrate) depolymerase
VPSFYRLVLAGLSLASLPAAAAPPLPALGAQTAAITVSGLSSGGFMAVQFHLAHSATVSGVGILAGGPWDCARGSVWRALHHCMDPASWAPVPTPPESRARATAAAAAGRIDPLAGLAGDRVWLFSGGNDHTVARPVVDALAGFYSGWIAGRDLAYATPSEPGHAIPSPDDPAANPCPTSDPPYINRCGELDAPGALLAHLLGPLAPKAAVAAGEILAFDQRPHAATAGARGLADTAYAYIPTGCRAGGCRVHVVFHGCRQSADQIGERFVRGAGYNRWAQANRLVVLYPQTTPRHGWSATWPPRWTYNPRACWDWWGYENGDYLSRQAPQIKAVRAMVERLGAMPDGP